MNIKIVNPNGKESGCAKMTVNGNQVSGNYVPEELLTDVTEIELTM